MFAYSRATVIGSNLLVLLSSSSSSFPSPLPSPLSSAPPLLSSNACLSWSTFVHLSFFPCVLSRASPFGACSSLSTFVCFYIRISFLPFVLSRSSLLWCLVYFYLLSHPSCYFSTGSGFPRHCNFSIHSSRISFYVLVYAQSFIHAFIHLRT